MRILFVSTLKRRIGPDITASRSQIIYQLAKGMVERGHTVSVLGTGDSIVEGAEIIPVIPKGFSEFSPTENPFYAETGYLVQLAKKIEELSARFDIVHNHTYPEHINLLISKSLKIPMITTVHAQATEEFDETLRLFSNTTLVSISKAHKSKFIKSKISRIIYNGIDTTHFAFSDNKREYLLWLGRLGKAKDADGKFMDAKGIRWAIELAQKTGEKLLLSGNVEDREFFEKDVKPYLNEKIQWVGPVSKEQALSRDEVVKLMQGAKAFLMTINWEEPFGLVMAEAGSCGTPVIGFNRGAVPEIVIHGKTGFVVDPKDGVEGLKRAVSEVNTISPKDCRTHIEESFSVAQMISNYEKTYHELINHKV